MVLQREIPIPVWGRAKTDAILEISLGPNKLEFTADSLGNWQGILPAMPAGGPYEMAVKSQGETLKVYDIYLGEVWLCSGQSNMEWPLNQTAKAKAEIPQANLPLIRLFQLNKKHDTYRTPYSREELVEFTKGRFFHRPDWQVCTPESAATFSGVGYYFGKELYDSLQVPIGLIQSAVGGSPAQSWIGEEALAGHPQLAHLVAKNKRWTDSPIIHPWLAERAGQNWANWDSTSSYSLPGHPFAPGYLFNCGIKPLAPYGIKGVIWYQGESNATHPRSYPAMMELLIDGWRKAFRQGDLPFYFVQLPRIGNRSRWPDFREAQQQTLSKENTGMVVAIDQGHPTDVHPREKKVIGHRLAGLILTQTYLQDNESNSPFLQAHSWNPIERTITLKFSHSYSGMTTPDNQLQQGIFLQGYETDGTVEVIILPEKTQLTGDAILLTYPIGFLPIKVKYAWAPYPENNLVNGAGLPLAPFKLELDGSN